MFAAVIDPLTDLFVVLGLIAYGLTRAAANAKALGDRHPRTRDAAVRTAANVIRGWFK